MSQKSLKLNMILNTIRGISGIIFPLITFPYVSRILGAENLGKYNFANSIISYFVLISALGIYSYAVREGSGFRNNREQLKKFADEIFTINMWSTIIAYILLIIAVVFVTKFHDYEILIFVLSSQILFKTLSVEWVYTIYEDFFYITVRSIAVQFVSLVLMFVFVRKPDDLVVYTGIVALSNGGSSLFNFIHVKKYLKFNFVKEINLKEHLRPIMLIFATSVAVTIYVSSDTTILGFLCDDRTVGIYSVSVKVYNIIKQVLVAILSVAIPRLAFYVAQKNDSGLEKTIDELFHTLTSILLPAVVGIFALSREVVLIVGGNEFASAVSSLKLLCVALVCCLFSWSWGQCVLMTFKKEKLLFIATAVSAIVNIAMNFVLIPVFKENAAALTTIIAEGITLLINWWFGRKYVRPKSMAKVFLKVLVGCFFIVAITELLRCISWKNTIVFLIIDIVLSIIAYFIIEIILRNEAVYGLVMQVKIKMSMNSKKK